MHRLTRSCVAALMSIALPAAVAAEPVNVTGFRDWQATSGLVEIQLTGDAEGFTFGARAPGLIFGQAPWQAIQVFPGRDLNLATMTDANTLAGRATFRGETHGFG